MMYADGLNEVFVSLATAGVVAEIKAGMVVSKTTRKVEDSAKAFVPIGPTEDLRDSINGKVKGTSGEVTAAIRYSSFVEYGTYKDAPQPFMGPALDRHSGEFMAEMEKIGIDI